MSDKPPVRLRTFVMPSPRYDDPINVLDARRRTRLEIAEQDRKLGDTLAYHRNTVEAAKLASIIAERLKA